MPITTSVHSLLVGEDLKSRGEMSRGLVKTYQFSIILPWRIKKTYFKFIGFQTRPIFKMADKMADCYVINIRVRGK